VSWIFLFKAKIKNKIDIWDVLIGLLLALIIPILFQLTFIQLNISNLLGGWPTTGNSILYWIIITLLIAIMLIPDELLIRKYQFDLFLQQTKKANLHAIFNIAVFKLLYLVSLAGILLIMQLDLLTIAFSLGFLAAIIFIQLLGSILFYYLKSIIPGILLAAIFTAWVIVDLLPFAASF
jgi:hypothetical protein